MGTADYGGATVGSPASPSLQSARGSRGGGSDDGAGGGGSVRVDGCDGEDSGDYNDGYAVTVTMTVGTLARTPRMPRLGLTMAALKGGWC